MKPVASLVAIAVMAVTARWASAEESIAPPAGWEVPPAPAASSDKPAKDKKKIGPACCKFDQTCCSRQVDIDSRANPSGIARVVEMRIADLPEATIREAAEGAPPITEGVPPVRLFNEDKQPFPWPKPPREIRMLPPGQLGDITWNARWFSPFFDEEEFQGLGWGEVHFPKEDTRYTNDGEIAGKIEYDSIRQGEGDKLIFDEVKGAVSGSPAVKATYHLHVEAAHVVDKVVHAYLTTTKDKEQTTRWVNFLLPQVIEGFESRDAKHQGGFFPSRFSRAWSYSLYRLPFGPGKSNLATFRLDDDDKRRWIGVSKKRPPKLFFRSMIVAASQTSAESEPRVRVMFFEDFAF